jgi:hypothetical protein
MKIWLVLDMLSIEVLALGAGDQAKMLLISGDWSIA